MTFVRFCSLVLVSSVAAQAQGTVYFANIFTPSPNAPVYEADGVTPLSGSQFMAELLAGPSAASLSSIATIGFLTGSGPGYFIGGPQSVPGIIRGNNAWVEVRVWNTLSGTSFRQAQASGLPNSWWQSSEFTVVLGGGSANPEPPAILTGLGNSPVYLNSVPEPSALAPLSCGLALALLKKSLSRQSTQ